MPVLPKSLVLLAPFAGLVACSAPDLEHSKSTASESGSDNVDSSESTNFQVEASDEPPSSEVKELEIVTELPAGFTAGDVGGYRVVGPLDSSLGSLPSADECTNVIYGVVRDVAMAHPDFESFCCWQEDGLVKDALGPARKPQYNDVHAEANPDATQLSNSDNFDQWYDDVDGVTLPFLVEFWLAPQEGGVYTFASNSFFPLNDLGFGNELEWQPNNFHFTTEIHTQFVYNGGEVFSFSGDDDLWVFIDGKLAMDLGGVHAEIVESLELDSLGLTRGEVYDLELFHAERHTGESNFRVETTLELVNCGTVVVR